MASPGFLDRLMNGNLAGPDVDFLLRKGFAFLETHDLYYNSHLNRIKQRKSLPDKISYIIAIPTLRCDLSCDYCQVSRANVGAMGFDWTPEITQAFKEFISFSSSEKLKIEFQGGEPTLRIDIIEDIIKYCDAEKINAEFVICTNLNNLATPLKNLLERENVFISTSIDGPEHIHTENRTKDNSVTTSVIENYNVVQNAYGKSKIHALPTITKNTFDEIKKVIDYYISINQSSIYLRPVNHQGFARKRYVSEQSAYEEWMLNYRRALEYIFNLNFNGDYKITEVGFEVAVKRAFTSGSNGHVDLRSPNPAARDYIVINYDGDLYPSDEARMLSRIRHVNLKIGNILTGINRARVDEINWNQMNDIHEDCIHCPYKPFCGSDLVDDLSRTNRTDLPKSLTYFCQSNMNTFDFIFSKLQENDPVSFFNIQGHLTGEFSMNPKMANWIHD